MLNPPPSSLEPPDDWTISQSKRAKQSWWERILNPEMPEHVGGSPVDPKNILSIPTTKAELALSAIPVAAGAKRFLSSAAEKVYHAAPWSLKDKILKEGIAPGSWFAKTAEEAIPFAQQGRWYDPYVVFEVNKKDLIPHAPDPNDLFGQSFADSGIFLRSAAKHVGKIVKEKKP